MRSIKWLSGVAVILFATAGLARADDLARVVGEDDTTFAARVLVLPGGSNPHITAADWNGTPTLFVDFQTANDDPERMVMALRRQSSGGYRAIKVTAGEQEGGMPDVAAIGFANADRDAAKELIVILTWPQQHYDVNGTLYEVRIFDDPAPGVDALTMLKLSRRFDAGCDCSRRDGSVDHYRFKTVALVRAELRRLGY